MGGRLPVEFARVYLECDGMEPGTYQAGWRLLPLGEVLSLWRFHQLDGPAVVFDERFDPVEWSPMWLPFAVSAEEGPAAAADLAPLDEGVLVDALVVLAPGTPAGGGLVPEWEPGPGLAVEPGDVLHFHWQTRQVDPRGSFKDWFSDWTADILFEVQD